MMKSEESTVKDAVLKLQYCLLQGIKNEKQPSAAGSLLSRSDYQDVVTERSIASMCGYPLCTNALPSKKPRKGRYRISLKDHKVYDLHETNMYCSSSCVIDSRVFAANLQEKRSTKHGVTQPIVPDILFYDMDFTTTIITEDEYGISKTVVPSVKGKESKGMSSNDVNCESKPKHKPAASSIKILEKKSNKCKDVSARDDIDPRQNDTTKVYKKLHLGKEFAAVLKSSLKTSDSQKVTRSVTWADGESGVNEQNLHECRELKDDKGALVTPHSAVERVGEELYRFASAEACARALSQAAEAVASGNSSASDAEPPPHGVNECKSEEKDDVMATDPIQMEWPPKPGFSTSNLFDSENSCYDSPPEGFNLTLSPFSTMFMALFSWISSSSLAYIHGKEECFHAEYLTVNGREYPRKIFTPDGRSSEIKQTLAGCLSRALPGLVTELRLPIPLSVLEQGMGRLLDTMSFIDPLPAFKMREWQVILVLFLEALSFSRIPALAPYMLDRRTLLPKVLEGAQINAEEFEIMKDLIIPFGQMPHSSTQSGG